MDNTQAPANSPAASQATALSSGPHRIFSVRPYSKPVNINGQMVQRPMWAFNRTPTSRGWHLSHAQLMAAGVIDPRLLQDTTMIVEFFEAGEKLLNGNEVTDGGVIVKNFTPEFDKTLLREAAKDLMKEQNSNWIAAAQAARNPARQQVNPVTGGLNATGNGSTPPARKDGENDAEYQRRLAEEEAMSEGAFKP